MSTEHDTGAGRTGVRFLFGVLAGLLAQGLGAFVASLALGFALLAASVSAQEFAANQLYRSADLLAFFAFQVPAGYLTATIASKKPLHAAAVVSVAAVAAALALRTHASLAFDSFAFKGLAFVVVGAAPIVGSLLWRHVHQIPNQSFQRTAFGGR